MRDQKYFEPSRRMVSTFDLPVIRERTRVRARVHGGAPVKSCGTFFDPLTSKSILSRRAPASAFLLVAISSVQKFHQTANNRRLVAPFED